jgi:hypothetical protein
MDKQTHERIVEQEISQAMDAMFPHGAGQTNHHRARVFLDKVALVAFREGRSYALGSLMTADDVAEHFRISARRARALIKNRHERFGIGYQVPGTSQWLVTPEELENLQPDEKYRIKKP